MVVPTVMVTFTVVVVPLRFSAMASPAVPPRSVNNAPAAVAFAEKDVESVVPPVTTVAFSVVILLTPPVAASSACWAFAVAS